MTHLYRAAVLGGGSFGTALSNMLAENGHHSMLWLRDQQRAREINNDHRNSRYLPDLILHSNVRATTTLTEAVADVDVVFVAVPSYSCREVAEHLATMLPPTTYIVSTTKGTEQKNFNLMSRVLLELLPDNPLAVLSGPNLAKEIVAKQLTGTVIASEHPELIRIAQQLLQNKYFKVYGNSDIFGVELGGTLKNIYAIVSGMAAAMNMGDNTRAMLMTRSLAEMSRFAVKLGANPLTFLGLAGVGDLIVTCSSPLSRNYQVGFAVGSGKSLEETTAALGQVAEGVNTLKLVIQKADELNVYMPLATGLYKILFEGGEVGEVIMQLMQNPHQEDVEFITSDS
jgi:glycerol-3-phosphate dehydrogenase (NAD(P)+)